MLLRSNASWEAALLLASAILVTYIPSFTRAHGRLINPPSRMSAWRFNFDVPVNYEDHQQYCGGFANQWNVNNGKCGICGDPWQGPRNYERPGGKMVPKLVITKTYKAGSTIDVQVEVTVNHLGWFEFRMCDVRQSGGVEATQACLDRHVLADRTGKTRFDIGTKKGMIKFRLVLPPGLTCPQCVMQWKWHCGNNVGYGEKQEEFYACSDVTITSSGATLPPVITPRPPFTPRPPVIVTNPPIITRPPIITNPPIITYRPYTNPPIVTAYPTREIITITNPPRVTLPPDLLVRLGDKNRPLADRIKEYANYQKTQIPGYDMWEASQLTFKSRGPSRTFTSTFVRTNNGYGTINTNGNNNGYGNNNNNGFGNNNNNGYGNNNNNGYGNNNNNGYGNNNNNGYVGGTNTIYGNNKYTGTGNNINGGGSNSYFCRVCDQRCEYSDCTTLCPVQCPAR